MGVSIAETEHSAKGKKVCIWIFVSQKVRLITAGKFFWLAEHIEIHLQKRSRCSALASTAPVLWNDGAVLERRTSTRQGEGSARRSGGEVEVARLQPVRDGQVHLTDDPVHLVLLGLDGLRHQLLGLLALLRDLLAEAVGLPLEGALL